MGIKVGEKNLQVNRSSDKDPRQLSPAETTMQQQLNAPVDVTRAVYPLSHSLSERLRLAAAASSSNENAVQVESIQDALVELVGNSLEAMDTMYFSSPPHIRHLECFQHRLCIRVATDVKMQTITLTDYGSGMTRSDLINSLGIGRQLTQTNAKSAAATTTTTTTNYDLTDDECTSSDEEDTSGKKEVGKQSNSRSVSCKVGDVGGFYAAVCALGIGVQVGTKSLHDEYYEYELGNLSRGDLDSDSFETFCIKRPMEEGSELSADNGFDKFEDVRGDSGTRVTIRLNATAVAAGLLDEEKLKEMLIRILETTQYTIAFSGDTDEAQRIIDASAIEKQIVREVMEKHSLESSEPMPVQATPVSSQENASHKTVKERAKYIPVRLSLGERKMLRLVEAAMTCCDYTTGVDRKFKSPARRTHEQLKGITAVLRGLVTACDYSAGQTLLQTDKYYEFENVISQMFEIARRHKVMNPSMMRTEYGKLIYLLQDAVSSTLQPHLGFSVTRPLETVYKFLEERGGLDLLSDKLIEIATAEILAGKKPRSRIESEIRQKERAVAVLKRTYCSHKLSSDDVHLCLYSICDNNSFLNSNRVPIDKVIRYLKRYFSADKVEEGYSLSIVSGEDGARLSHSHERQYYFALQSLTLWRDITDDMFRLWAMAEADLLNENVPVQLQETGQGLQRVQQSPRTYQSMQQILVRIQANVHWVGSSVIHLGDHNVPNALSFIDKYTQVPRILGPLVACIENIERLYDESEDIEEMIDGGFGGIDTLRKDILYDFFRSAFDGSGADNFYDAGSCIDGRLTSAWHWCSQLSEKSFYPIFKLTGFTGFDGEFK